MKKKELKKEPPKTKQLQLSKEEFLEVQLCQQRLENLHMQSLGINSQMTEVIKNFCKRVGEKPEKIVTDQLGRLYIDESGKVTFKEG